MQSADKYDRPLEALGLVYAHYLHRRPGGGGRGLLPSLRKAAQPQHEAMQPLVAAFFVAFRQLNELHKICSALRAVTHGAAYCQQIQLRDKQPQKFRGGHIRGGGPKSIEPLDKGGTLFIVRCGKAEGGVKVRVFISGSDAGKLVCGKREGGGAKHRYKRYVLMGIVGNSQHGNRGGYLNGAEISSALHRGGGYALHCQRPMVGSAHGVGRAQQNGHIAVFHGAKLPTLAYQRVSAVLSRE